MTRWTLIIGILAARFLLAQDVTGAWVGDVAGNSLARGRSPAARWIVTFSKDRRGELRGTILGAPAAYRSTSFVSASFIGSKLTFTLTSPSGPTSFVGTLSDDGNSIEGWLLDQPLTLQREGHAKAQRPVAPPVAPAMTEQAPAAEPSEILSRALAKLAGTGQRLVKYSCTETIERAYYSVPSVKKMGPHAISEAPGEVCGGREFGQGGNLSLDTADRLRLAVAVASDTQIQSWAAASRFDSRPVFEMIPEGPMSTGAFGSSLVDIFENAGAKYRFIRRKNEGSRTVFVYAFEVPLASSHSRVVAGTELKTTAYHGSFDIDAASAELVRLTSETDPLPPETKMCRFKTETDYHYMQIGDGQFLMPSRSDFDTLGRDGGETRSVTTFSACHEYAAESTVAFNLEAPADDAKAAPKAAVTLPAGVSLTLALLEPIDLRTAAAGDAVAAKVTKAVRAPGSNQILVEAGAVLHGRITAMQHRYNTTQFAFAIRYETLEQRETVSQVAVELDRELKAEQARVKNGFARRGSEFSLPRPAAPGDAGGWFAVSAASGGYVVAAGSESKWVTVAQ